MDQLVFAKLVPPEHSLGRVKRMIDFERLRALLQDCDSPGMGRGAEDPVRVLQLEFLQPHATLSDREVIADAQVKVACRCFLDLSLDSRVPGPSLLAQFRTRLGRERPQALFDQGGKQARAQGLRHDRWRLKDATHVVANMAVPTTLAVVAQTRQRLLASARLYWPERGAQEEADAGRLAAGTAERKDVERLTARVAPLRAIVAWADAFRSWRGRLRPPMARVNALKRRWSWRTGAWRSATPRSGAIRYGVWSIQKPAGGRMAGISLALCLTSAWPLTVSCSAPCRCWRATALQPAMPRPCWRLKSRRKAMKSRRCRWTVGVGRGRSCIR